MRQKEKGINAELHSKSSDGVAEWGRRARQSAFWVSTTTAGWQLISWVLTILTARYLIPADYGVMSLAETLLPYFLLISSLYSRTWMIQLRDFSSADGEAMMSFTSILGVVAAAAAFAASPVVAEFYGDPGLTEPFRIIAVGMAFRAFSTVSEASLSRELHFKELSVLTAVVAISRGLLQLGLAYNGYGFWSLVLGYLYRDLGLTVGLILIKGLPQRFGWNSDLYRQALIFGVPATASALLSIVYSSADRVVVGKILGTEVLGYYAFAAYVADLPTAKLNMMFRSVLIAYFSRLKDTPEIVAQQFLKVARVAAIVTFPILVGMAVTAPDTVPFLLGEQWRPLIVPLQVMSLVCLLQSVTDMIPWLLTSYGYPGRVLVYNLISIVLLPVGMWLGVSWAALPGAYLTWVLVLPVLTVILTTLLRRTLAIGLKTLAYNLSSALIASLLMGGAVILFAAFTRSFLSPLFVMIGEMAVGVSVYALSLYFLFNRQWQEAWAMVKNMRS